MSTHKRFFVVVFLKITKICLLTIPLICNGLYSSCRKSNWGKGYASKGDHSYQNLFVSSL